MLMRLIRIYSQELVLESEAKKTYLVITEVRTIDQVPLWTYYYEMPKRFKWIGTVYSEEEHFYSILPN